MGLFFIRQNLPKIKKSKEPRKERKIRFSYRINYMKTRNDHGEKCFIQNKYTPNAKLKIVGTDKTTLKKFSLYFETRELDTLYREAALSQTRS